MHIRLRGDLIAMTDRDKNVTTFSYSQSQAHFLTEIQDGLGLAMMTGQYTTGGRLSQITDAKGNTSTFVYNLSTLTQTATIAGNTTPASQTYSSGGLLTQSVDSKGNVTTYTYNGSFLVRRRWTRMAWT